MILADFRTGDGGAYTIRTCGSRRVVEENASPPC